MTLQDAQQTQIGLMYSAMLGAFATPIYYMSTSFSFVYGSDTWNFFRDFVNAFPGGTGFPNNFALLDVNGKPVSMTYAEALALVQMIVGQGLAAWQKFLTLEVNINAATTVPGVHLVQW